MGALGKGRSPSSSLNLIMRSEAPWIPGRTCILLECTFLCGPFERTRLTVLCPQLDLDSLCRHGSGSSGVVTSQELPSWMGCKAFRGLTTGGLFLLVFCCCVWQTGAPCAVAVTAQRLREHLLRGEHWLLPQLGGLTVEVLARYHIDSLSEWLEE